MRRITKVENKTRSWRSKKEEAINAFCFRLFSVKLNSLFLQWQMITQTWQFRLFPQFLWALIHYFQLCVCVPPYSVNGEGVYFQQWLSWACNRGRSQSWKSLHWSLCLHRPSLWFFELVRHVKRGLEKVYCFQPLGFLSPLWHLPLCRDDKFLPH